MEPNTIQVILYPSHCDGTEIYETVLTNHDFTHLNSELFKTKGIRVLFRSLSKEVAKTNAVDLAKFIGVKFFDLTRNE